MVLGSFSNEASRQKPTSVLWTGIDVAFKVDARKYFHNLRFTAEITQIAISSSAISALLDKKSSGGLKVRRQENLSKVEDDVQVSLWIE